MKLALLSVNKYLNDKTNSRETKYNFGTTPNRYVIF
jgi:hypothetical protein